MKEHVCKRGHPVYKIPSPLNGKFQKYYCKICKKYFNQKDVLQIIDSEHIKPTEDKE